MICPYCETMIPEGSEICPACGSSLRDYNAVSDGRFVAPGQAASPAAPPPAAPAAPADSRPDAGAAGYSGWSRPDPSAELGDRDRPAVRRETKDSAARLVADRSGEYAMRFRSDAAGSAAGGPVPPTGGYTPPSPPPAGGYAPPSPPPSGAYTPTSGGGYAGFDSRGPAAPPAGSYNPPYTPPAATASPAGTVVTTAAPKKKRSPILTVLIWAAAIAAGFFLYRLLFVSDSYQDVAEKFAKASANFDLNEAAEYLAYDVKQMAADEGESWSEVLAEAAQGRQQLRTYYGSDYKISVKSSLNRKYDDSLISIRYMVQSNYGNYVDVQYVTEAVNVHVDVTVKGSIQTQTIGLDLIVIKYKGSWKVLQED